MKIETTRFPTTRLPIVPRWLTWPVLFLLGVIPLSLGSGCGGSASQGTSDEAAPASVSSTKLRVWLLGEDPLFVERMTRLWSAEGRGELVIRELSPEAYLEEVAGRPNADVLIYPQWMIGELHARQAITKLPKHVARAERLQRQSLFDVDRRVTASWADEPVGFSLGTRQLVLLYRADLFADWGLTPPTTWDEYRRVAETLRQQPAPEEAGDNWLPLVEPLADVRAGDLLLARVAPSISDRSSYSDLFDFVTLEPLIDRSPYTRALGDMQAALGGVAEECAAFDAEQTTSMLLAGQTAMAIGLIRPSESEIKESAEQDEQEANVRLRPLPGSTQLYQFSEEAWRTRESGELMRATLVGVDGYNASVVTLSRRTAAAQDFLLWLMEPDTSLKLLPFSEQSAPFREEHLNRLGRWVDRRLSEEAQQDYRELLEEALSNSQWVAVPRIPGADKYRESLATAVRRTLLEDISPAETLQQAAQDWERITATRGEAQQLKAYEASLELK